MRLCHNLSSLNIYRNYTKRLGEQSNSLSKISSGVKLSSAKDDPNNLAKSEYNKLQIKGLQMASKNIQDGVSLLQTFEGGLDNMSSMLQRMRELVIKSGSGINNEGDISIIQGEIDQLINGYNDIANNTEFNGVKLLNGSMKKLTMTIGVNEGETADINCSDILSNRVKLNGISLDDMRTDGKIDLKNLDDRNKSLNLVDYVIDNINSLRSSYGALENRYESSMKDILELSDRIDNSNSQIIDTDVAEEIIVLTKSNLLVEASNAMMAQSNKMPQDVLRILENIRGK